MSENNLKDLKGFVETTDNEPDFFPKTFYDSIKIYNGNLYVYDYSSDYWISAGRSETSGTTLPDATTNNGRYYYKTDTDTLYRSNGTAWIAIN